MLAPGRLLVRDGLPFLVPDGELTVRGALLGFSDSAAYERIVDMEPKHLYQWRTIEVAGRAANVLYGTKPSSGNPIDSAGWDGWEDPLFTEALSVVKETWRTSGRESGYARLFYLQMAYMLLWSAIERYLTLRYSLGERIMKKTKLLGEDVGFADALKRVVPASEGRSVTRSSDPDEGSQLDPDDPKKSALFYYGVRSNVTHRGKTSGQHDTDLLEAALTQLLSIFGRMLEAARADARHDETSSASDGPHGR